MEPQKYNKLKENVEHGDFTFPYIWYYTELPDYYTSFPMHWHEEMEIINVFEGEMEINIDLTNHVIHKGEIAVIKPGELHSFRQYKNTQCKFLSLLFHPGLLYNNLSDSTALRFITPYFENKITGPSIIPPETPGYQEILNNVDRSFEIYDRKQPYYELELKEKLFDLLYLILSQCCTANTYQKPLKTSTSRNIKTVIDYIQAHYNTSISISRLAELLNLSEHYFMRYFKAHIGITCIEFINDYRLNMAAKLLSETGKPINEIGTEVGITNISYFNRLFKKKFNVTPKEYRFKYHKIE